LNSRIRIYHFSLPVFDDIAVDTVDATLSTTGIAAVAMLVDGVSPKIKVVRIRNFLTFASYLERIMRASYS
jgi:hypothetical protein